VEHRRLGQGRRALRGCIELIRRTLLITALAVALLAGVTAPAAVFASDTQVSIMSDDALLLGGTSARVGSTLVQMKSLGVQFVRVTLLWSAVDARTKAGFVGLDPARYPAHAWDRYDRVVRIAHHIGLGVYFDITGPGPAWAMGKPPPSDRALRGSWMPDPSRFYDFVYAAGRRYDGRFKPAGAATPLPRVRLWSIWNQPNAAASLAPQWQRAAGAGVIPYSPVLYRELYLKAHHALTASGHAGDAVLAGETAPSGTAAQQTSSASLPPLTFARELLCVDSAGAPYGGRAAAARQCGVLRASGPLVTRGWAQQVYGGRGAPDAPPGRTGDVDLASLDSLTSLLDTLAAATHELPAGLPVYISRFGASTPANLNDAQHLAYLNPRVFGLTQEPYEGDPDGLLTASGHRRDTWNAYRLPFSLDPLSGEYWGDVTFSLGTGTLQLAYQSAGSDVWVPFSAPLMPLGGFFTGTAAVPAGAVAIRAQWRDAGAAAISSRAVALT
jgi:hypothetical protein